MLFYLYAAYMLFMNAFAFFQFWKDKKRAIRHRRRVPEWVLFWLSAGGGCFGAYISMRCFHHKTYKGKFAIGVPTFAVLHIFIAIFLIERNIVTLPF